MAKYLISFGTDQDFGFPSFERYGDAIGDYTMMIETNDLNHFLKDLRADCNVEGWRADTVDDMFEELKTKRCYFGGNYSADIWCMNDNCPGHWEPYIYEEE